VDGIITDDSDVFLFGGETVYRKFFEQTSFVESYQINDIKSQLGLDRQALINLALMLGSDYTNGVKGVGIVFAVEILNEFGTLEAFRDWLLTSPVGDSVSALQKKLLKMKIELSNDFPSEDVVKAYMHPDIDASNESFSWALPDLDAIRTFAQRKFGLAQSKVDFHLLPILKRFNERKNSAQGRIDDFVSTSKGNTEDGKSTPKYKSKRLDAAMSKLVGATSVSSVNIFTTAPATTTSSTKKRRNTGTTDKKKKAKK